MELKLYGSPARDELRVIDSRTRSPIPFNWKDHSTVEVDDAFADVATIETRVIPASVRKRFPAGEIPWDP